MFDFQHWIRRLSRSNRRHKAAGARRSHRTTPRVETLEERINPVTFNLIPATGMSPTAIAGFQAAADLWSAILTDPVTVNININFTTLGTGILGSASSATQGVTVTALRNALNPDAKSLTDQTAVANLPAGSTVSIYTSDPNTGSAVLDNNGSGNNVTFDVNQSTAKALGLRPANDPASDASITFSDQFTWDFDRGNGIAAGAFDFIGVAGHEIGHALGFRSGADTVDATRAPNGTPTDLNIYRVATTLDLFRHSAASVAAGADFDIRADTAVKYFSLDGGATQVTTFSTGVRHGDGRQASHWKDNLSIGQLDPTAAPGEYSDITDFDVLAFDAIGWDVRMDYGDAPDTGAGTGAGNYQTTLADNGPRHALFSASGLITDPDGAPKVFLGTAVEADPDGQPGPGAAGDPDDGVVAFPDLLAGTTPNVTVTSSATGASNKVLNYFFDFNRDGDFADPGESFTATLTSGSQAVPVTIPAGASLGTTVARFRISTAGGLSAVGPASDGEVEDYLVTLIAGKLTATLDGAGNLTVTDIDGPGKDNALSVSASGTDVVITDATESFRSAPAGGSLSNGNRTLTIPLASVTSLTLDTGGGSDAVTVTFSGGDPIPTAGLAFRAGSGTDALRIVGVALSSTYSPDSAATGDGVVTVAGNGTVTFTGLESIDYDVTAGSVALDTGAGADDAITIENGTLSDNSTPSLKVSGTVGGVAIVNARVRTSAITVTANDGVDAITVAGAGIASGVTGITVDAGTSAGDAVSVTGAVNLGAGGFSATAAQVAVHASLAAGAITLTADAMDLMAPVSGGGPIVVQPAAAAATIGLHSGSGTFNLTAAELAHLSTAGTVTIGRPGGTGAITVAGMGSIDLSAETFNLTLRGGATSFLGNSLTLPDDRTLTLITGSVSETGGTDVIIGGAGTLTIHSTGGVDLDTRVSRLGTVATSGGLAIQNGNTSLTLTGSVINAGGGAVSLSAGTGTLTQSAGATLTVGDSATVLTADEINLGANLVGTSILTLEPATTGRGIEVAGAGGTAGVLNLTAAELGFIQDGFTSHINIGSTLNSGPLTVVNPVTFHDPVWLNAQTPSLIVINGQVTGQGNASVSVRGDARLNANIVTSGGPISFALGHLTVGADVLLDTTGGGGGGVTFNGSVASDSATTPRNLTVAAGGAGVTFVGPVGATNQIGVLAVTSASLTDVRGGTVRANDIRLTSDSVELRDATTTLTALTDDVVISGALTLRESAAVITGLGAGDDFSVSGPVNSGAPGLGSLTATAGAGYVTFTGAVGNANPLRSLTVHSAALTTAGAVKVSTDISITSDDLALTGAANSVESTAGGMFLLRPVATARAINLNAGTGGLDVGTAELAALKDGFGSITIGDVAGGTGPVDVNASTFNDPLTLAGGSITVGATAAAGLNAGSNAVTLTARTGSITDGGDGGPDISAGAVSLNAPHGTIGAGGDAITLAATSLNTDTSTGNGGQFLSAAGSLTIDATGFNAGTGTVELAGGTFTLGGGDRVNDGATLNVNGSTFDLGTFSETLNTLTLTAGSVSGTTGVLTSTNTIQALSGSVSAILAGANGLTKSTGSTVTLSGANTYAGATTVSGGRLRLGAEGVIPNASDLAVTGTLDLNGFSETVDGLSGGGTVTSGAAGAVTLIVGSNNEPAADFFGVIHDGGGTVALTKSGSGTQTLSGANTHSGATAVDAGVLEARTSTALGSTAAGTTVAAGATLQFNALSGSLAVGAEALTLSGAGVGGTGALRKVGTTGATYAGNITLAAAAEIQADTGFTINGDIDSAGFRLTVDGTDPLTVNGVISGAGGLTRTGSGVLTLTNVNTYTGTTLVSAGSLAVHGSTAAGSAVSLAGGTIRGTGTINGPVSMTPAGGRIAPGTSLGVITVSDDVILHESGSFVAELHGTTAGTFDQLKVAGTGRTLTLHDATLNVSLGGFLPTVGDSFTIIDTVPAGNSPVSGTFRAAGVSIPDGGTFPVGEVTFGIDYDGGPGGNDVVITVLTAPTLSASLSGGDLTVTDLKGTANQFHVRRSGGSLVLTDVNERFTAASAAATGGTLSNGNRTLTIADFASAVGGTSTVHLGGGTDSLTVDLSGGDVIPAGGLSFVGGESSGDDDRLILTGGTTVATVHVTHTGAEAGAVTLAGLGSVHFAQIEPLFVDVPSADLVISLPAGPNTDATLGDDGVSPFDGTNDANTSAVYDSTGPSSFEYTQFRNPTNSLTIQRGSDGDRLTVLDLAASGMAAALTIGSAAGAFNQVTFNGPVAMAANRDLTVNAAGTISLSGAGSDLSSGGTGAIRLTTARNIALAPGSSVTTVDGPITLSANQQATPSGGNFSGIDLFSATVQSVGNGTVTVLGRGGNDGAGNQHGVRLLGDALVSGGSGAGATTVVHGTGGASAGAFNSGVAIASFGTSHITSAGGSVRVTGTGGGAGASPGSNHGVAQYGGKITSIGSGSVHVTGTGGAAGATNHGVELAVAGQITAPSAAVLVTGQGGGAAGTNHYGIRVGLGTVVATGGTDTGATVTLDGQGGATTGVGNVGVYVDGTVSSANQAVTVLANSVDLGPSSIIAAGAGTVAFRPRTAGTAIDLGSTAPSYADRLDLSDAELDRVMAGTLIVGDATTGAITISAAITRPTATAVQVTTGAALVQRDSLDAAGGTLRLSAGGNYQPLRAGTDLTASAVSLAPGTDLSLTLDGPAVDTASDRLVVAGTVHLSGVDLVLGGSLVFGNDDTITLVSASAVANAFSSITVGGATYPGADGTTFAFNGKVVKVTYHGTAVTLALANKAPSLSAPALATVDEDTDLVFTTISVGDPEGDPLTVTLTASSGRLTLSGTAGLSFGAGDGTADASMTFSGTVPAINAALSGVKYRGEQDRNGLAPLAISVSDGVADPKAGSVAITVNPVNDAPVVSPTGGTLVYIENEGRTVIDPGLVLTDVDSATLIGATVRITAGFAGPQDVLSFTDPGGISGALSGDTLTLSGTAPLAVYQAALRSVSYRNASEHPATTARAVTFTVHDGATASNTGSATRPVSVVAVNDAPAVTSNGLTLEEAAAAAVTTHRLSSADPDNDASQVIYTVVTAAAHGTLFRDATPLGAGGTFTQADLAANRITYRHDGSETTGDGYTFSVTDGTVTVPSSGSLAFAITVNPVNDAPVAADDPVRTYQDTPVTFDVRTNDTDAESAPAALTVVQINGTAVTTGNPVAVSDGTVTRLADGGLRFAPAPGFHGGTRFTYVLGDGVDASHEATVTVTVVDNVAPEGPVITGVAGDTGPSPADGVTSDTTLTVSGTAEDGSTVELFRGGTSLGTTAAGGGVWSLADLIFSPGTFALTARATDAAGNQSSPGLTYTTVVDTVGPTLALGGPSAVWSRGGLAVTYTVTATDTHFHGFDTGKVTLAPTGDASGSLDFSEAGNVLTVTVRVGSGNGTLGLAVAAGLATDEAGNLSAAGTAAAFTVDNVAPAVAAVSRHSPADEHSNAAAAVFRVTFSEPVVAAVAANFTPSAGAVTAVTGSGTTWDVTVGGLGAVEGAVSLAVSPGPAILDAAGNALTDPSPASSESYLLDHLAPTITVVGPSQAIAHRGEAVTYTLTYADPNFTGSVLTKDDITLLQTGAATGSILLSGSGTTYTVTVTGATGLGTLAIGVAAGRAGDRAGNAAPDASSDPFTVNDAPTGVTVTPAAVAENRPAGSVVGVLGTADSDAGDGFTYSLVTGAGDADNARFRIDGGLLKTAEAFDHETTEAVTVRVRTTDRTGLSFEGAITVSIIDVDDRPVARDDLITLDEDVPRTLPLADLTRNDTDPGVGPLAFTVTSGPGRGTLTDNGDGTYTYRPEANFVGTDRFRYRLANGFESSGEATVTLTVRPVNDRPSFVAGPDQTVSEGAGPRTVIGWATDILPYPASPPPLPTDEAAQKVSFRVVSITYDSPVYNTDSLFFSAVPAIGEDGTLTYAVAAEANGTATVTVTARDGGGGDDTSPPRTFTITATPVNDAPTFIIRPSHIVPEDAPAQRVPGFATAVSPGPPDEAAQAVTFHLSTDNDGLFTAAPAITPEGTLAYAVAAEANGTATVTVTARDGGGGDDTSPPRTFTITVTPVNDAPSLDPSLDTALSPVPKNDPNPRGDLVDALFGGILDPDADARRGIAVVGVSDPAQGAWQYSADGVHWAPLGPVSTGTARLLSPPYRVRFVPANNYLGPATLRYHAWDLTGGADGGTASLLEGVGGSTAFSAGVEEAILRVATALVSVKEDTAASKVAGTKVSALFSPVFKALNLTTVKGIAVTGLTGTADGTWQYSLNGRTYLNAPEVGDGTALLLKATHRLRFVPNANFNGNVTVTYRGWNAVGVAGGLENVLTGGTRFSAASDTSVLVVKPVSDVAPTLDAATPVNLPAVPRTSTAPEGVTVASFAASLVSGMDAGGRLGIAVTRLGLPVVTAGAWQFSSDGGRTWKALGTVSAAKARLLTATDRIRFLPRPGTSYVGPVSLEFKAWDQSVGLAGGLSAVSSLSFSRATAKATLELT